jgi:DNA-binding XRE family transcriptional regulator
LNCISRCYGYSKRTCYKFSVKIEVRAVGLKAMREKRGLTQRKLAHELGISQNCVPAAEQVLGPKS